MGRTKSQYKNLYEEFRIIGVYRALVVDVYDGDTITCVFDPFPESQYSKKYWFKVRLMGIDTPEMKPTKSPAGRPYTSEEKKYIKSLAEQARKILQEHILNNEIIIHIHDVREKYGRLLGDIYPISCADQLLSNEDSYNHMLCNTTLARRYTGGTKYDWTEYQL